MSKTWKQSGWLFPLCQSPVVSWLGVVARQVVVDVVNAKTLDLCIQNCVLAMEIANMLYIWLGGKKFFIYFLKFFGSIFSH